MIHTEDELIEMFTKHHYVEGWSVTSFVAVSVSLQSIEKLIQGFMHWF